MNITYIRATFMVFVYSLFTYVLPMSAVIGSEWYRSKAAYCAQHENWGDALRCLNDLRVENPDDPELLYDSGVVAYRMKEFEKANVYFEQAVQCETSDCDVKKQAYFNLGNTCVALKKLADAIKPYELALEIDPDDERAKHNLELVKQLLEQQNQDTQQKKQEGDGKIRLLSCGC